MMSATTGLDHRATPIGAPSRDLWLEDHSVAHRYVPYFSASAEFRFRRSRGFSPRSPVPSQPNYRLSPIVGRDGGPRPPESCLRGKAAGSVSCSTTQDALEKRPSRTGRAENRGVRNYVNCRGSRPAVLILHAAQNVGWAKERSDVPTIRCTAREGGHGARAPLPTLPLCDHSSFLRVSNSSACRTTSGAVHSASSVSQSSGGCPVSSIAANTA
jgi:hypothetical protein